MNTAKEHYKTYQADDSWSELSEELVRNVIDLLPVHVLEFGCGTGKHLSDINQAGICAIGVDISPMNVYKAIHKYDLPCVICGDEGYLRHLCNIDIVFTCSVLDHIPKVAGIVDEMKRIANKTVFLAETQDEVAEYYYCHDYAAMGFEKLDFSWKSEGDGAMYHIWKWEKAADELWVKLNR